MKVIANEGYVWAEKDLSAVYSKELYLGIYDSVDNYIQVEDGTEASENVENEISVITNM